MFHISEEDVTAVGVRHVGKEAGVREQRTEHMEGLGGCGRVRAGPHTGQGHQTWILRRAPLGSLAQLAMPCQYSGRGWGRFGGWKHV